MVETQRTWQIKKMGPKHREIARLLMLKLSHKEIAVITGYSPASVAVISASPVIKEHVNRLEAELDEDAKSVAARLQGLQPMCVDRVEEALRGSGKMAELSPRSVADIAFKVLAIGGHSPVKKIATAHAFFSDDDLDELKKRKMAAARAAGLVVEEAVELTSV